jgi:4-methyl-5(b-hydroxyethyl)-thiazole monophosphate biosynthesis
LKHKGVASALLHQNKLGKRIGAICAGPMVLGAIGLLEGKKATCSPGFEKYMTGAEYTAELYTIDGNIITGEGPAATLPYAYKILSFFVGEEKTQQLQVKMQFAHLMEK